LAFHTASIVGVEDASHKACLASSFSVRAKAFITLSTSILIDYFAVGNIGGVDVRYACSCKECIGVLAGCAY